MISYGKVDHVNAHNSHWEIRHQFISKQSMTEAVILTLG